MSKSNLKKFQRKLKTILGHKTSRQQIMKLGARYVQGAKIEGDYLEFGVYLGRTLAEAYRYLKLEEITFYAFDWWGGYPEGEGRVFKKGARSVYNDEKVTVEMFKKWAIKRGIDLNRVSIINGLFQETLPKTKLSRKAALIYIDVDIYPSAKIVMDYITDYIQVGTLVMFDDWFSFGGDPNQGEIKAFNEWLKKNPHITVSEYYKYGWHGNSFLITGC